MFSRHFPLPATVLALSVLLLPCAASADTVASSFQPDILFHSLRHGASQIYLANSVTGEMKRLRESANEDIGAMWSPDGKKIAFVSRANGNSDIYVIDADGANPQRLTDHPAYDGSVLWSPDGSKLAFTSGRSGSSKLYTINADGSGLKRLTTSEAQEDEANHAWSPDGKQLAFVTITTNRQLSVWVTNSNGGTPEQLTKPANANATQPVWSPDGSELAYVESKKGRSNLRIMTLASKAVRNLTDDNFRSSRPTWTPDGSHVVFESLRAGGARTDLFMIPSNGGEAVNLTTTPANEDMDGTVSGNGQQLAYVSFIEGKPAQLFSLNLGNKALKQLTQSGALEFQPVWRPVTKAKSLAYRSAEIPAAIASLR